MHPVELQELQRVSQTVRADIVGMSHASGLPHVGGALSCVDILVAAYFGAMRIDPANPNHPERDRFILSKGHAAAALYATLARRGLISLEQLATYGRRGSSLTEHPSLGAVAGIEVSTGSLGHGLSLGAGMAFAGRLARATYRVFVTLSDGECNEGSVWEAAMLAAGQRLDHLVAIVDYNKWQATGRTEDVSPLQPFRRKWESFGWSAYEVDGHDLTALVEQLAHTPDGSGKPVAIIAHTVKGKGVSFMEDDNNWHYRIPTADEVRCAHHELQALGISAPLSGAGDQEPS